MISWGLGSFSRVRSCFSSSSSRMMSLHSSTHSSQTNTDGPAMSLRTSCWLLPQNEQYSSLPSSCLPLESSVIRVLVAGGAEAPASAPYMGVYSTRGRGLQKPPSHFRPVALPA